MACFQSNKVMRNLRMRLVHRPAITTERQTRTGNTRSDPVSVRARSRAADVCLSGLSKLDAHRFSSKSADSPQTGKQGWNREHASKWKPDKRYLFQIEIIFYLRHWNHREGRVMADTDEVNVWRSEGFSWQTASTPKLKQLNTNDLAGRPRAKSDTWRNTALNPTVWNHFPLHFLPLWLLHSDTYPLSLIPAC